MEVSAYDEALAIPTETAATLALRVQQVIQEETNITAVSDPLGGSWYVESLTNQLAEAAMELTEQIEAMGGYIQAQRDGRLRTAVEDSAQQWRELVNSGQRRVVGLNCHTESEEEEPDIFTVDPAVEQVAIERIRELRARRDADQFRAAMTALEAAAGEFAARDVARLGDGKLMEAAIAAARADATTGEMMGVLQAAPGLGAAA